MSVEQDALTYLEALFGQSPSPSVIVVSQPNGKGWRSHFPLTPQDAVPLVLGVVDIYVRITPLAHQPKPGKRGLSADAVSLPAVWAELDVDGTPDGKGGVKTGALPSLDAAVEVAHSVLVPTLEVGSGGGLHPYWILDAPLLLDSDEARESAARLVEGFQERLRREARERFGAKLDSTHDLARVLRPPGSFNGKGAEPRPVQLLDDGGPRYSIEQLAAEAVEIKNPSSASGDDGRRIARLASCWSCPPTWSSSSTVRGASPATARGMPGTSPSAAAPPNTSAQTTSWEP